MVRRSVLLVVSALALALSASAYAEVVTPVLKAGQTQMFAPGQLAPGRTVVCAAGSERLRGNVPFIVQPGLAGASYITVSRGNGLSLSIAVQAHDPAQAHDAYTVTCNRMPAPVCIPPGQPCQIPYHIPEFVPTAAAPTSQPTGG
jgi:hypothetical protein